MFAATTEMSNGIMTEPTSNNNPSSNTTSAMMDDSAVAVSRKRSIEEVEEAAQQHQDGIVGGIVTPGAGHATSHDYAGVVVLDAKRIKTSEAIPVAAVVLQETVTTNGNGVSAHPLPSAPVSPVRRTSPVKTVPTVVAAAVTASAPVMMDVVQQSPPPPPKSPVKASVVADSAAAPPPTSQQQQQPPASPYKPSIVMPIINDMVAAAMDTVLASTETAAFVATSPAAPMSPAKTSTSAAASVAPVVAPSTAVMDSTTPVAAVKSEPSSLSSQTTTTAIPVSTTAPTTTTVPAASTLTAADGTPSSSATSTNNNNSLEATITSVPPPQPPTESASVPDTPTDGGNFAAGSTVGGGSSSSLQQLPDVMPAAATATTSAELNTAQLKFCLTTFRRLKTHKNAAPFLVPVDPVKLGIPTYFDIVKDPMDMSTIERKLTTNQYSSPADFIVDVDLMFSNCHAFNGAHSPVGVFATAVWTSFKKSMERMPADMNAVIAMKKKRASNPAGIDVNRPKREVHPPSKEYQASLATSPTRKKSSAKKSTPEIKFCYSVLRELTHKRHAMYNTPFLLPVNWELLRIPHYPQVIRNPMDLSSIKKKLDDDEYHTADDFADDVHLMFKNCYTFNKPHEDVYKMGQRLEAVFDDKWSEKPAVYAPAPPHVTALPQMSAASASKPPKSKSHSVMQDSDSSSSDDDGKNSSRRRDGMNNQQIAMLQQNLALMTSQLTMLMESKQKKKKKKEKRKSLSSASTSFPPALAAPKPRSKPSAPSKPRNRKSSSSATAKKKTAAPVDSDAEIARMADHEIPEVTQDQKVFLTSGIEKLEPTDLGTVINLIKEGMPGLQDAGVDEIELDINQLDKRTLYKLYKYVFKRTATPAEKKASAAQAKKSKKSGFSSSSGSSSSDGSDSDSGSNSE